MRITFVFFIKHAVVLCITSMFYVNQYWHRWNTRMFYVQNHIFLGISSVFFVYRIVSLTFSDMFCTDQRKSFPFASMFLSYEMIPKSFQRHASHRSIVTVWTDTEEGTWTVFPIWVPSFPSCHIEDQITRTGLTLDSRRVIWWQSAVKNPSWTV